MPPSMLRLHRKLFPALLFALALLFGPQTPAQATVIDRVAVVVNGKIITLSEVEERVGPSLPDADDRQGKERRQRLLRSAGDELIAEKLLAAEVAREGLAPSSAEIDAAIADVKRANRLDDRSFEMALRQQGLDHRRYREMLSDQIGRMKLLEMKIKSRIKISDDDIRARYRQQSHMLAKETELKARDIFVPKGSSPQHALKTIQEAQRQVLAGDDFADVARRTGGPFADSGGDLGWFRRGMLVEEIEDTAFSLEPGELSEIVEGDTGYHLILLEDRRTVQSARTFEEAKDQLAEQLFGEKMQAATEEYVEELRRDAQIEWKLP